MLTRLTIFALYFFISITIHANPVKIIGKTPEQSISINKIEHSVFDDLLNEYVDENGDVNYTDWQAKDFETLQQYLETLSQADPEKRASKAHKLAFWINAYNALTIYGILEQYPTSTIRNHTSRLFGYNIWKDLKLNIADTNYSLDDIEHKVLRKMDEPRIHFAIVCASKSCPRLINEAYSADKLNEQLNNNAKVFFASEGNFKIDSDKRRVYLSSILDWFGEDFADNKNEVVNAITPFLNKEDAATIKQSKLTWKVSYLPYDWKLNDQKRK